MAKKYSGLFELIDQDAQAKAYYDSLPDYIRSSIEQRANHVNSYQSLRDYVENLSRGDG